jgi:dTDP-L-rhamnose 4-epimerase
MTKRLLITGGAGFIGSHLAEELVAHGYSVRVLDNADPRVHAAEAIDSALPDSVEIMVGDIRDGEVVERALEGIDAVFHFASVVADGDNDDEVDRCRSVNNIGTAILMDRIVRCPVERLVVASSMSVYGEGLYRDPSGAVREVGRRTPEQLERADWEPWTTQKLAPAPTPETKAIHATSVYARSKHEQERLCLRFGRAFDVPTIALRFFNVFGPRQVVSSPYSGDLARFAARLLAGCRPLVPEDGAQRRDFVGVRDVAVACRLAIEAPSAGMVVNVGRGESFTLAEIAQRIANLVGRPELSPETTGDYQLGDVRHCFADVERAKRVLGYQPRSSIDPDLLALVEWVASAGRAAKGGDAASSLRWAS